MTWSGRIIIIAMIALNVIVGLAFKSPIPKLGFNFVIVVFIAGIWLGAELMGFLGKRY